MIPGNVVEREAVLQVAKLMCIAARTAPKTRGIDNIVTCVVYGDKLKELAAKMRELASRYGKFFERDAKSVENSDAVVLIGVRASKGVGLNCSACGFKDCKSFEEHRNIVEGAYRGPVCVMEAINLGIAVSSAVKVASILNVDNRVMFSVGTAARVLKLIDADIVLGIPVSARGKNIYFDRA